MKKSAALGLVLASAASAQPHTARQDGSAADYAATILHNIQTAFKVNDASLPKLNVNKEWQGICIQNFNDAEQVSFYKTGTIKRPDILDAKAFYIANVEATSTNPGKKENIKMVVTSSTTTSQVDTKGWTVGAKLTGTAGKEGVASGALEFSGSYSDTSTKTDSVTKTISIEAFCEPGYACRIETWAFHMDVHAKPQVNGFFQLWSVANSYGKEIPTCSMPKNLRSCEQFTQRINEWCTEEKLDGGALWIPPKHDDLKLKVPVFEENGYQTFSRVVLVSEPIKKQSRAAAADPKIGDKDTVIEAIKQGTKFQFLD